MDGVDLISGEAKLLETLLHQVELVDIRLETTSIASFILNHQSLVKVEWIGSKYPLLLVSECQVGWNVFVVFTVEIQLIFPEFAVGTQSVDEVLEYVEVLLTSVNTALISPTFQL